jgi:hypothetical protein
VSGLSPIIIILYIIHSFTMINFTLIYLRFGFLNKLNQLQKDSVSQQFQVFSILSSPPH